jgi:hypothetical protein
VGDEQQGLRLDGPTAEDCELEPDDVTAPAAEPWAEEKLVDEALKDFNPDPIRVAIDPVDGLPTFDDTFSLPLAPPFDRAHVVCVEDDTVWVEIFREELEERGWEDYHDGHIYRKFRGNSCVEVRPRSAWSEDGEKVQRAEWPPDAVDHTFGMSTAILECDRSVAVRPRRERCRHYRRMLLNVDRTKKPVVYRNCSARKSEDGAYLSLSDTAVLACDYREPPDEHSVAKLLDEPDRQRLDTQPKLVPLFGRK